MEDLIMKKTLALVLAVLMLALSLVACSGNESKDDATYIEEKGTMIMGITYFEPMNYKDGDKLVGFETEFAEAVCEILGVTPVFQEINWKNKTIELNGKTIDCIWNGMTIDDERLATMSISQPYLNNKQILVVKAENVGKYTDAESFKGAKLVAEAESAGETVIKEEAIFADVSYTAVDSMKTAIMEVAAGTADACVVDYVTSIGMIGEGTAYDNLSVDDAFAFADEQYGIAFRKDSTMTAKVNDAINELLANGKLAAIAEKYKLEDLLITE